MASLLCSRRKQYLKQVNSPSSFTYPVLNLSFQSRLLFPSRVPLRRSRWRCYGNLLSDAPSSLFFGGGTGGGGTGGIREVAGYHFTYIRGHWKVLGPPSDISGTGDFSPSTQTMLNKEQNGRKWVRLGSQHCRGRELGNQGLNPKPIQKLSLGAESCNNYVEG